MEKTVNMTQMAEEARMWDCVRGILNSGEVNMKVEGSNLVWETASEKDAVSILELFAENLNNGE